jgi:hypothetical protein
VWGECQGSAQIPYRTQIDLQELAFHCTCPSRKFPCKHSLGLFLLNTEQPTAFNGHIPPPWVTEWLLNREEQAANRARPPAPPPAKETSLARKAAAQTRRVTQRQDRVVAGINEVELWLRDLVRQGLAVAQGQPPRYWENMAARMVDAQAPGIARWLREMSSVPASGEGWAERLLERIGLLHLLVESYKRLDQLPEAIQADVRSAIGFTLKQEDMLTSYGVSDVWGVLGQRSYEEDRLRVQRTWLQGQQTGRTALVLDFAYGDQLPDSSLVPGTQFTAELVFYPGNYPLRTAVKRPLSESVPLTELTALTAITRYPDSAVYLAAYAQALARNPWLEVFPVVIEEIVPIRQGERWTVYDRTQHVIPLARDFAGGWQLQALSGGRPLTLVGEWDGYGVFPLTVWAEGRFVRL